jgi:hypothetical protein
MRKSFIGYYPPNDAELKQIWQKGIIVLDANVLLNLYRYSKEARRALLELIAGLADRLWLPYQVATEYHRHRLAQIYSERRNCDEFVTGFRKLLTNLDESRRQPFVGSDLRNKLDDIVKCVETEIKPIADELDEFKRNDPILDQLTALYDGKVGAEPDVATKDAWLAEGEERYRRGVPPGFEDRKKADERKYGDLFVWKEILAYAGGKNLPVMFVTDDAKRDWWREQNGETIGPNPALVGEMVAATGQPFHMYRPERFIEFANRQVAKPIPEKIVEEVKNVRVADRESARAMENWALSEAAKLREQALLPASLRQAMQMVKPPDYSASIREAMQATKLTGYSAAIHDAMQAVKQPDYTAAIREAMQATKLTDYSAAIHDAMQAMKPLDYSAALRESMRGVKPPDYNASVREAMQAITPPDSATIGEAVKPQDLPPSDLSKSMAPSAGPAEKRKPAPRNAKEGE